MVLSLKKAINVHLGAKESGDQLVFLHSVKQGPANKSYGLQVAKLAGIPKHVITHAKLTLKELEQPNMLSSQIDDSALLKAIKELDPDDYTPKTALEKLYYLHSLIKEPA